MKDLSSAKRKLKGNRGWVKNAIIIFLAILLVMTFFSNTIMNYSLPEVAAQYPSSTTITSKIRGSGTVEAAQSYNVTIQETRTVAAVNVKAGDTVAAGQVLMTLDASESEELVAARETYNNLKLELDKLGVETGDANNVADLNLQQAQEAVSKAQSDLSKAQTYESSLKRYQDAEASAKSNLDAKQAAADQAQTYINTLETQKRNLEFTNPDMLEARQRTLDAQAEVNRLASSEPPYSSTNAIASDENPEEPVPSDDPVPSEDPTPEEPIVTPEPESEEHRQWRTQYEAAQQELAAAQQAQAELLESLQFYMDQQIAAAETAKINADAAVTTAQSAYTQAQDATTRFQNQNPNVMDVTSAEAALEAAQQALETLEATNADEEAQQTHDDAVAQLDYDAKKAELEAAEANLKNLEEAAAEADIVSRYPGVVTEVNIAAGDKTTADTPLMVVELTEKGYTLTATVSKNQAKLLQEGQQAEITNLWNAAIDMTLVSIATDKTNPAENRTLTFALTGDDVSVGQSISFSVGNKNATYDVVVPSAAVHTDADGSFVYVVEVKSSPLGNRYSVRKKTVTVIASDDTNSALSGDVSTADFIITNSTAPLDTGSQVRIAE